MTLSKPAITEFDVEKSVEDLFAEWVAYYFSGTPRSAPKADGTHADKTFPTALFRCQQTNPPQPLNGVLINLVWSRPAGTELYFDRETATGLQHQRAFCSVLFSFYVVANVQESGAGNSVEFARRTADALHGLLNNADTILPLANKGITELSPRTPALVGGPDYAARLVLCHARLEWAVFSQNK